VHVATTIVLVAAVTSNRKPAVWVKHPAWPPRSAWHD